MFSTNMENSIIRLYIKYFPSIHFKSDFISFPSLLPLILAT